MSSTEFEVIFLDFEESKFEVMFFDAKRYSNEKHRYNNGKS